MVLQSLSGLSLSVSPRLLQVDLRCSSSQQTHTPSLSNLICRRTGNKLISVSCKSNVILLMDIIECSRRKQTCKQGRPGTIVTHWIPSITSTLQRWHLFSRREIVFSVCLREAGSYYPLRNCQQKLILWYVQIFLLSWCHWIYTWWLKVIIDDRC